MQGGVREGGGGGGGLGSPPCELDERRVSAFERWQARKGQWRRRRGWMDEKTGREKQVTNGKGRERARLGCSFAGRREKEEGGKGNGD